MESLHSVTDEEALEGFERLSKLEGIIPALETSHALAHLVSSFAAQNLITGLHR